MSDRKRANGTGCVYARKRKDGSIRGYWIKFYVNGDQRVRNAHTTDKDEAERQLAVLLGQKAEDKPIARRQLTLGGAVDNVKRTAEMAGRTLNYVYEKHLVPFFGRHTKMAGISTTRVKQYMEHRLKAGASNATVNRETEALSKAFTLAMQDGALHAKPYIPSLPEDNVRKGFFERDQFDAPVDALRAVKADPLIDVVTFAYITGWRRGEVLGLKWKNVDLTAGTVRLEPGTTKNKEGRTFFMTDELRALITRRLAARPGRIKVVRFRFAKSDDGERFLFTRKNGARIGSFNKRWHSACRAADIPDRIVRKTLPDGSVEEKRLPGLTFHDFRRTAVRNLERAGVPRSVAMKMIGHKTESVYRRYAIVSERDLQEASRKLEAMR